MYLPEILLSKKFEIEETTTTYYSTFKTDIIKVGLIFSISNFFINKTYQANNWSAKKIPSCANLALSAVLSPPAWQEQQAQDQSDSQGSSAD